MSNFAPCFISTRHTEKRMQNTTSTPAQVFGHAESMSDQVIGRTESSSLQVFGRTELALQYFPRLTPRSAWQKFRALLIDDPTTAPLARQSRRTFMPAEVSLIYRSLGRP